MKNKPIAYIIRYTFLAAFCLIAAACVHIYPEEGKEVDPTEIELTFELSTDPSVTSSSVLSKSGLSHRYVKFAIELYEDGYNGEPVFRREMTVPATESGAASVRFTECVHAGEYRLAAFAAYAENEDGSGCLYDISSLGNIVYASDTYTGSTDLKECYDLRMDINLPHDEWFASKTVSGILEPPVGRVEIISEDVADFVAKVEAHTAAADEDFWQTYEVKWDYALYFPVGYNVFTGVPNLADTGVGFTSEIVLLNDKEALMGYDYVFVNGERTEVNISLKLYEKATGELLNTYSGLSAEILKGETTVIRGDFLTTEKGSGIGIDPGFDGSIDITLPDRTNILKSRE